MKTSGYLLVTAAIVAALSILHICRADPVEPVSVTFTNFTGVGTIEKVSDQVMIQGDYLLLTNCVMYTGSDTNSEVQNLDGCTITVTAGHENHANYSQTNGFIISTNAGTYGAYVIMPTNVNPCRIEVSVSNTYNRTYPRVEVETQAALGE